MCQSERCFSLPPASQMWCGCQRCCQFIITSLERKPELYKLAMDDNVTSTFKAMFAEANRLSQSERFVEADDLCFRLLRRPTLPLLYRAGCNLLLSFGEDHPVEHAEVS